jgi:pantoate--beta-alanine ligase
LKVIRTIREMQEAAEAARKAGGKVGLVPTMGYLHEGHLALVRKARELADLVVVSIFVNPIQFGPKEDLSRYPRDFERDSRLLEGVKTDVIFAPEAPEMYPEGYSTYIEVRGLGDHLCGLSRQGHFVGVATVVAKLFNACKPHFAVFGQKDYQQLKIIERMVRDLNMGIEIVAYPTVREEGGLAMSSRNTYLGAEERANALLIRASMKRAEELFKGGERNAGTIASEVRKVLASKDGIDIEYVEVCDPEDLGGIKDIENRALLAIAARVGKTRLIDNTILTEP